MGFDVLCFSTNISVNSSVYFIEWVYICINCICFLLKICLSYESCYSFTDNSVLKYLILTNYCSFLCIYTFIWLPDKFLENSSYGGIIYTSIVSTHSLSEVINYHWDIFRTLTIYSLHYYVNVFQYHSAFYFLLHACNRLNYLILKRD